MEANWLASISNASREQQIGRAGRDGNNSYAKLFFDTADIKIVKTLVLNKESIFLHSNDIEGFNCLVSYVLNIVECRNKILHDYFHENLEKNCGICDNCLEKHNFRMWDVTQIVDKTIELLSENQRKGFSTTPRQLMRILKGQSTREEKLLGVTSVPGFGYSKARDLETGEKIDLSEEEVNRMIIILIASGYLTEDFVFPDARRPRSYVRVEKFQPKIKKLLERKIQFRIPLFKGVVSSSRNRKRNRSPDYKEKKRPSKLRRLNKRPKRRASDITRSRLKDRYSEESEDSVSREWYSNEEFEVEEVLDQKTQDGKNFFLLKWKNYTGDFNSWEPEDNLSKQTLDIWKTKKLLNELI